MQWAIAAGQMTTSARVHFTLCSIWAISTRWLRALGNLYHTSVWAGVSMHVRSFCAGSVCGKKHGGGREGVLGSSSTSSVSDSGVLIRAALRSIMSWYYSLSTFPQSAAASRISLPLISLLLNANYEQWANRNTTVWLRKCPFYAICKYLEVDKKERASILLN